MSDHIWSGIIGALVVALVYMLVRPGSKAATAVTVVGDAMGAVVGSVTGWQSAAAAAGNQATKAAPPQGTTGISRKAFPTGAGQ